MICLLVMTDGRRECIDQAVPSALSMLDGPISRKVIHDDSGDPAYRSWLASRFPEFELIGGNARSGFGGAYRNAWSWAAANVVEPWVFSTEDDFTCNRRVDLVAMIEVLTTCPHVAQMALRRQPWNAREKACGGVVEAAPYEFDDRATAGHPWLEHRLFWTTNPSLFPVRWCAEGWPDGDQSEGRFTHRVLADPGASFGYWGSRASGEWVHHIGDTRVGTGY